MHHIQEQIGAVGGRVFVDSAPVLEKAWAAKSGLGWVGKNTNLIRKQNGSYFFIAELILDIELEADGAVTDHCGSCTACLDACPTDAFVAPYKLDASKCISYFTIELKDAIPNEVKGQFDNCQFVRTQLAFTYHNTPIISNYGLTTTQHNFGIEIGFGKCYANI